MYGFKYVIFNEQNIFACIIYINAYRWIDRQIDRQIDIDIDMHARSYNLIAPQDYTRQI